MTHLNRKYVVVIIIAGAMLFISSVSLSDRYYLIFSFIMVLLSLILFFIGFEKKNLMAEEMVMIAMLSALAGVSRVPFSPLPSVQPTSFVIIMAALSFGGEVGFIVGSTAALVSNIFLGQGPWTPWQMFSWGLIGLTAGMLKDSWFMKRKWGFLMFGFIWGYLFGWIMNLWFVLYFQTKTITLKVFFASCIASFRFDLNHALSNMFFLYFFKDQWLKILYRAKTKYGLLKQ